MTTKIKALTPKTYQGKVTGYSVELEDGTKGYLDDKASDKDLKVGEVVNFELAVKQNKKGENYNLLTIRRGLSGQPQPPVQRASETVPPPPPARETPRQPSGTITPVDIFNKKADFLISLKDVIIEKFAEGKIDSVKAKEIWETWKTEGCGGIDELAKG